MITRPGVECIRLTRTFGRWTLTLFVELHHDAHIAPATSTETSCTSVLGTLPEAGLERIDPCGSAVRGYDELFFAEVWADTLSLPWGPPLRGWGVNDIG